MIGPEGRGRPPAPRAAGENRPAHRRRWWPLSGVVLTSGGALLVLVGLLVAVRSEFSIVLLFGAAGLLLVVLGLRDPVMACVFLLIATFFRLTIPSGTLPVDPFLIAYAGVVGSTVIRLWPRRQGLMATRVDPLVCVIVLYLGWNAVSMVLPHVYAPGAPLDVKPFSVSRFVVIGIVMPLTMFFVGQLLFVTQPAIRVLLWSLLVAAAYSALVSILQFAAPPLVWPRYVISNTAWPGRAVGIFNQPVVNGLVLITGFVVALLIASAAVEVRLMRVVAVLVALACVYALYLTHTRAVWLSFAVVVAIGAVAGGRRLRRAFVLTLMAMVLGVATNWSTFTSSDRSAGGVGSVDEVQDRLNTIATSIWAFKQRPWLGWGIGRFPAINTYHHQSYSPEIPWQRGYGIPSHLDALGILVELGVVGLGLWVVALVLIYVRLVRATRSGRWGNEGYGRALGLTALLCLVAQTTTGLTVDLRFFDFPNIAVMLVAGGALGLQRHESDQPAVGEVDASAPPSGGLVGHQLSELAGSARW